MDDMNYTWLLGLLIVAIPVIVALRIYLVYAAVKQTVGPVWTAYKELQEATKDLQTRLASARKTEGQMAAAEREALKAAHEKIAEKQARVTTLVQQIERQVEEQDRLNAAMSTRAAEFKAMQAAKHAKFEADMASIKGEAASMGLYL